MKVLHLINTLSAGGAELHLLTLCKQLKQQGTEVVVGYLKEGQGNRPLQGEFEKEGIRVVPLGGERAWDGRYLLHAVRWVKQERPDLLHSHLPRADLAGFFARRFIPSIPWICSVHDIYERSWRGQWTLPLFYFIWRYADRIIAISEAVKNWLVKKRIPAERIDVVHYGIDVEPFLRRSIDLRSVWGLQGVPLIGSIGRLEPRKGHEVLIRAMPMVLRQVPEARLLIAGHNPWGYGETLQSLIYKLGLDGLVQLVGFQSDIPSFLHALDIFAFASRSEGFGQVVIEAMAAGKPVVASRIPPLTEIIVNGETGLLVEPNRPEAFAEAIVYLVSHPEKALEMGRCGQERVRARFAAERMAEETLALYRFLLNERR